MFNISTVHKRLLVPALDRLVIVCGTIKESVHGTRSTMPLTCPLDTVIPGLFIVLEYDFECTLAILVFEIDTIEYIVAN